MRRATLSITTIFLVACYQHESINQEPTDASTPDSSVPVTTRCEPGGLLVECQGDSCTLLKDCTADVLPAVCVVDWSGVAQCAAIAAEFQPCIGTGKSNCDDGLVCGDITYRVFRDRNGCSGNCCLTDCSSDPSICGPGRYCEQATLASGGSFASPAFCYPRRGLNATCLLDDAGCSDGLVCRVAQIGFNPQCKRICAASEVGAAPASCGGEKCLPGPQYADFIEVENTSTGVEKSCGVAGTPDVCTVADGYKCMEVETEEIGYRKVCARRSGICGTEVTPLTPGFSSFEEMFDWVISQPMVASCDASWGNQYCGNLPDPTANAVVECVTGPIAYWDPDKISCSNMFDDLGCFGKGRCARNNDGVTYECLETASTCVAFCTSKDGLTEYNCGAGYDCVVPLYTWWTPAVQRENNEEVLCYGAAGGPARCDSSNGFECGNDLSGWRCVKPRKICIQHT